jgi:hypothetical protein
MKNMLCAAMLLGGVCAIGAAAATTPREISDSVLQPYDLVEGTTVTVRPNGGAHSATFEVTHVYKGNQIRVGSTFDAEVSTAGDQFRGNSPYFTPLLKTGEKVLWVVKTVDGRITLPGETELGMTHNASFAQGLPRREGDQRGRYGYAELVAWAKAVEAAVEVPPAARYELLKKDALGGPRLVVPWALLILGEVDRTGELALCRELIARPDANVWRKVVADRSLANHPPRGPWRRSAERLRLYQSWARQVASDADAVEVHLVLQEMARHDEFAPADVFDLLKAIAEKKDLSGKTRASAVATMRYIAEPDLRTPLFEYFLGLVSPAQPVEVQRTAAQELARSFRAELKARRKDVEAARANVQDEVVAKLLDGLIGNRQE